MAGPCYSDLGTGAAQIWVAKAQSELHASGALKPGKASKSMRAMVGRGFAAADTEALCCQPPGLPRNPDPGPAHLLA